MIRLNSVEENWVKNAMEITAENNRLYGNNYSLEHYYALDTLDVGNIITRFFARRYEQGIYKVSLKELMAFVDNNCHVMKQDIEILLLNGILVHDFRNGAN